MTIRIYLSPTVNLLKAMAGSGIAFVPILFVRYGVLFSVLGLALSVFFVLNTLNFLLVVNSTYGTKDSISTLALRIYPPLRYFVDILVCLKCYSVTLAYFLLMKEQIIFLISVLKLKFPYQIVLLVFTVLGVIFCTIGKFEKIKFVSALGILGIFMIFWVLVFKLLTNSNNIHLSILNGTTSIYKDVGVFIYAFGCHQAILSIQKENSQKSLTFLQRVAAISITVAFLLNVAVSSMVCKIYGNHIIDDWINSLPKEVTGYLIRALFSTSIALSIPIQMTPFTTYIAEYIPYTKKRYAIRLLIALLSLGSIFTLSLQNIELQKTIKFIGSTISPLLYFFIPSLYYSKLPRKKRNQTLLYISYATMGISLCIFTHALLKS